MCVPVSVSVCVCCEMRTLLGRLADYINEFSLFVMQVYSMRDKVRVVERFVFQMCRKKSYRNEESNLFIAQC